MASSSRMLSEAAIRNLSLSPVLLNNDNPPLNKWPYIVIARNILWKAVFFFFFFLFFFFFSLVALLKSETHRARRFQSSFPITNEKHRRREMLFRAGCISELRLRPDGWNMLVVAYCRCRVAVDSKLLKLALTFSWCVPLTRTKLCK